MKKTIDKKIQSEIINNYVNKGYGLIKSGKEFGIGQTCVKRILQENGVKIRTLQEANSLHKDKNKMPLNDNYFQIQSCNMAYILGILASDGTVKKDRNEIKLTLERTDRELLEKIHSELDMARPIRDYEDRKGHKSSSLVISSKQIKNDIAMYGIIPEKTFNLVFPKKLEEKYYIDYIRGFFDGDGCICQKHTGQVVFSLYCACPKFLQQVIDYFYEKYSIAKKDIYPHGSIYKVEYAKKATEQIYHILYTPNSLYMKRKKDKFDSIFKK